jgi:hypothetical protein
MTNAIATQTSINTTSTEKENIMKTSGITIPTNATVAFTTESAETQSKTQHFYEVVDVKDEYGNTETQYQKRNLPPVKYKRNITVEVANEDTEVIVALTRQEYVNQYKKAEERSARETLSMCRLVYEASKSLNSAEFSDFCKDIGYKDYSSVIRKFIVIGKLQPRMIQHAEILPASWSAIYSLTQIPAQSFENIVSMNRSFKEMTVSEVNKLVKETRDLNKISDIIKPTLMTQEEKDDKIQGSTVLAKVYFTKVPDDLDWHAFEKALLEVQANLPVRVQFLSVAKEVFNKRKNKRYEQIKADEAPNPFQPQDWDMGREVMTMNQTSLNDDQVQAAA